MWALAGKSVHAQTPKDGLYHWWGIQFRKAFSDSLLVCTTTSIARDNRWHIFGTYFKTEQF